MIRLDEDIWSLPLPFKLLGCKIGTTTTIVRSAAGVALISPGPLTDDSIREILDLGPVTLLIAPNKMHHLYLNQAIEQFPKARVLLAPGLAEKRPDLAGRESLPQPLDSWGLEQKLIRGLPDLNETAFFHTPTGTLVLTDLAFHFPAHSHLPTRLFLFLNGALGRFGPTRMLKRVFLKERELFQKDMAEVLQWPIRNVVVGHGQEILGNGLEKMREAFSTEATRTIGAAHTGF
jgi:hypothetical protein